LLISLSIGSSL